ncbi:hypothetical protein EET67_09975 [Pseudaminobacter arsenicus]|uniref:Uncharacterized protein n=1 Tax=Borborobacter arsenicus TaxID=1851146 RepID=A0A432V788_9HYPH|nr:hypothetical protein [Pseudaminobacter arsenicus]RUM97933.1 hypothetical protein EET67_09975 [Pseudaminobacter arsenicus]
MNEADIRRIVAETVTETLTRIGIEADDPLEAQKDFQHLRSWRTSTETIKRQSLMTAIGIVTAGVLGLIWMAVKGQAQ